MWLLLLLFAIPLIEIALFIEVGGRIGLWPTVAAVVASAIAGAATVRAQGLATIGEVEARLRAGGSPAPALAHGALILAAGLLLLIPGFLTDALGLLLLVRPLRSALIGMAASRIAVTGTAATLRFTRAGAGPRSGRCPPPGTIDAEYTVVPSRDGPGELRSGPG